MANERVNGEGASDERAEDYSYDLAHEAVVEGHDPEQVIPELAPHTEEEHVTYVATRTTDTGGDYGYDMAHDLPPAQNR